MSDLANNLINLLNMDDSFNDPPESNLPTVVSIANTIPVPIETVNPEEDVRFAQDNIRNVIRDGSLSLRELFDLARGSEHPRAYEVLGNFMKTYAELNKDLISLHQLTRKQDAPSSSNTVVHADKAVFVGSTAELGELLKKQRQANNATDLPQ